MYWDQLGGLQDDAFMVAVRSAVGFCKWFPTVAELRQFYRDELRRQAPGIRIIEHKPVDKEAAKQHLEALREAMRCRTR